jgi:hypothetical protein
MPPLPIEIPTSIPAKKLVATETPVNTLKVDSLVPREFTASKNVSSSAVLDVFSQHLK